MSLPPESEPPVTPRADVGERASEDSRLKTVKPNVAAGAKFPAVEKRGSGVLLPPPPAAMEPVQIQATESNQAITNLPVTLRQRLRRNRRPLSSVLVSFLFHGSVLVGLFLLAISWPRETQLGRGVVAEFSEAPLMEDPLDSQTETVELNMVQPEPSLLDSTATDVATEDMTLADAEVPSVVPVDVATPTPAFSHAESPATTAQVAVAGGGLAGRSSESRAALAAKHGGSGASEAAVERGLKWIIDHQSDDGGWRLQFHGGPCDGRCGNQGLTESPNAATGLALLSLLGAGYTSDSGPYQKQVSAGIEFLLKRIRPTAGGGSLREGDKGMYGHAIATMALSEAYAMTQASDLSIPVIETVEYIEKAQQNGGWRYEANQVPGDMLVTGWQIMALKSAQNAGFKVNRKVLAKADAFVDSLATSQPGQYAYGAQGRREAEPVSSAVGMLMKLYQGRRRGHPELAEGALYLSEYGMVPNDIYHNYYATLVLHHRRGRYWPGWNEVMRNYLVAAQATDGHEAGSWHFDDDHGTQGGRLYSTAMAVMTLEVYYRFLPLYGYDRLEENP